MRAVDHVVLAIIEVDGRYALQWRDDKPGIAAPGMWSLFGGAVEDDEATHDAILREIHEELRIAGRRCDHVVSFDAPRRDWPPTRYSVFAVDLTAEWPSHTLTEGRAARVFEYEKIADLPVPPLVRAVLHVYHHRLSPDIVRDIAFD